MISRDDRIERHVRRRRLGNDLRIVNARMKDLEVGDINGHSRNYRHVGGHYLHPLGVASESLPLDDERGLFHYYSNLRKELVHVLEGNAPTPQLLDMAPEYMRKIFEDEKNSMHKKL